MEAWCTLGEYWSPRISWSTHPMGPAGIPDWDQAWWRYSLHWVGRIGRLLSELDNDPNWVDCNTEVTANTNAVFVAFQDSYNWGCPLRYLNRLDSTLVDTGASHSLMSEKLFLQMWPGRTSPIRLRSYAKQPIVVRGCCNVNVHYRSQTRVMPLLIV